MEDISEDETQTPGDSDLESDDGWEAEESVLVDALNGLSVLLKELITLLKQNANTITNRT